MTNKLKWLKPIMTCLVRKTVVWVGLGRKSRSLPLSIHGAGTQLSPEHRLASPVPSLASMPSPYVGVPGSQGRNNHCMTLCQGHTTALLHPRR